MKLSEHFTQAEFECHSGVPMPPGALIETRRLCVDVLELVRAQWAAVVGAFASPALVIISGYRDPAYNKRIGGATHSQHMNGSAADLRPVRIGDVAKLADVVDEMIADGRLPSLGGFGKYMGWIHLDTWRHPSGKLRRWNGAGVGSEPA